MIVEHDGTHYKIDSSKDQILKRGILDPYDLSSKGNEWVVLDEFVYWSARLQSKIIIPTWFITDLASIPRLFRTVISVNERHRLASLPHDFGYALKGNVPDAHLQFERNDWDNVFDDFCIQQSVSWFKRKLMYAAIRTGGWVRYKAASQMYIPVEHRAWYIQQFPQLKLSIDEGAFICL